MSAKVQAIRGGCELYVNFEPCPMRLSVANWARLDAVYFAAVPAMRPGRFRRCGDQK